MSKANGYQYTRAWFDFAFENTDLVTASHGMLYLWLVEINNRLGWVEKFQVSATECKSGMCCKSYNTYKKCFDDLVDWGFVKMVKQSVNQYQCNVIALSNFNTPHTKALDKAIAKAQGIAQTKATETFLNHKPKTIKPKTPKSVSEDGLKFADWSFKNYFSKIKIKENSLKSFAATYDTLIRLGYTKEQIVKVVEFARKNPFLAKNFQSPNKLTKSNSQDVRYIDIYLDNLALQTELPTSKPTPHIYTPPKNMING